MKHSRLIPTVLVVSLLALARLIKATAVIGTQYALFSGFAFCAPLAGYVAGTWGAALFFLGCFFGKWLLVPGALVHPLNWYLPSLCASWYWSMETLWARCIIRCLVPALCIVVFVTHPSVGHAWIYAMYWLIPLVLYYIPIRHPFAMALGSTFVAHAVGSVIWLFCVPMRPEQWLALLPVVFVERFLSAVAMTLLYYLVAYFKDLYSDRARAIPYILG